MTGADVKALRALNGMTQAKFGEALGVSRVAVNTWENERFQPPVDLLAQMDAKGLQTRVYATTQAFALYDCFRRANFSHVDAMARMAIAINKEKSCGPFTMDDKLALARAWPDALKA